MKNTRIFLSGVMTIALFLSVPFSTQPVLALEPTTILSTESSQTVSGVDPAAADQVMAEGNYLHDEGTITKYIGKEEDTAIPTKIDGVPITAIGERVFENSKIKSVLIPDGIRTIGRAAFSNCGELKSIVIPKSVKSIDGYAFDWGRRDKTSNLTKVIFMGEPPMMGVYVFYNCNANLKIYYPSSEAGYNPNWQGCTCVAYDSSATYHVSYDGNGNDGGVIPVDNPTYHTGDTFTVLADSPTRSGYLFKEWNTKANGTGENYNPGNLVTVGIEEITLYAIWSQIHTITKDPAMKNGSLSFYVKDKEVSQAEEKVRVTIAVKPNEGYRYEALTLHYSDEGDNSNQYIDNILDFPLGGTGTLFYFTMPDKNITVTADFEPNTTEYSVDKYGKELLIKKYYGLGGNIFVPSNIDGNKVVRIHGKAFSYQDNLTGVTLPEGITEIEGPVFLSCSSLSAVELPDSMTSIGSNVFNQCTNLKSIRMPKDVSTFGDGAFYNCSMLDSVCFEGNAPSKAGDYIFENANKNLVIFYREGTKGFDITPWANYARKEYRHLVKYKDNGAERGIVPREHILLADDRIQIKENSGGLVKSGYQFDGWNTKADGTGTNYGVGTSVNVTEDKILYAKWTLEGKGSSGNGSDSGKGSGSGRSGGSTTIPSAQTSEIDTNKIETKADKNGKVEVTEKQVFDAMTQAEKNSKKAVMIQVDMPKDAKTVETKIPKAAVAQMAEKISEGMGVVTPVAELSFNQEALKTIAKGNLGDLNISVAKGKADGLSQEAKGQIGDRPIYRFIVTSGNQVISQFGGTVTLSIPYTLGQNENTNALVIYYINGEGKLEMVKDCVYDSKTGRITFKTNHFSQYAVGYHLVSFHDVSGWYEDSVMFLAARDIVKGKSQGYFMPNDNITRAEFVQILANMAEEDGRKSGGSGFGDVQEKDWFCSAVAWANEKEIVKGSNGNFNPNANITREDMAVMIERYVKKVGKGKLTGTTSSTAFADEMEISDYAKTAVSTLQSLGILTGKENHRFVPKANATRAEGAKMLALVIQGSI